MSEPEGPYTSYESDGEAGEAVFRRVCPKCGRFAKAHKSATFNGAGPTKPNADCKRCGPVMMSFLGYF